MSDGTEDSTPGGDAGTDTDAVLDELFAVVESRKAELPEGSYTASLFTHEKGENAVLEKLGEECTELLLAAKDDDREELGGRVDRVVVSELRDGTYIADIHLNTPRQDVVVDARPSDSLAMAARTNVPIEVSEAVFEEGREDPGEFEELRDIREVLG